MAAMRQKKSTCPQAGALIVLHSDRFAFAQLAADIPATINHTNDVNCVFCFVRVIENEIVLDREAAQSLTLPRFLIIEPIPHGHLVQREDLFCNLPYQVHSDLRFQQLIGDIVQNVSKVVSCLVGEFYFPIHTP